MELEAVGKSFDLMGDHVLFKRYNLLSEKADGGDKILRDASDSKDWNDMILGDVLEIGGDVSRIKVGNKIGVLLSNCLSILDLMESEELAQGNDDIFVIPEELINTIVLEGEKEDVE